MIEQFIKEVELQFRRLVLPALVPIYASNPNGPSKPDQVGTGFLIESTSRPMLVTAKHTLFGHDGSEEAGEKALRKDEKWVYFGDVDSQIHSVGDRDIACVYVDELKNHPCLMLDSLQSTSASPITFGGFLSRDFKRQGDVLSSKPYVFSGVSEEVPCGLIGLQYQRSNVRSSGNEMRQTAPQPRGLSGGPMSSSSKLALGQVGVVGVFTEQSDGTARGEPLQYLRHILMNC